MALIEEYTQVDISGQTHALELHHDESGRWHVICWQGYDPENLDFHWDTDRKIIKMCPEGRRILEAIPFDETLAREEFEKWRQK